MEHCVNIQANLKLASGVGSRHGGTLICFGFESSGSPQFYVQFASDGLVFKVAGQLG